MENNLVELKFDRVNEYFERFKKNMLMNMKETKRVVLVKNTILFNKGLCRKVCYFIFYSGNYYNNFIDD